MEEISKKIRELELKASRFDDFEENFKPVLNEIFRLTEQIQEKLQEINPIFKTKSYWFAQPDFKKNKTTKEKSQEKNSF